MTITQHAHIYSFHTSNFNFGEICFLFFINTAHNTDIADDSNEEVCIESSGFWVPCPDNKYKGSFIAVTGVSGLI
jgi:hypothetical protein